MIAAKSLLAFDFRRMTGLTQQLKSESLIALTTGVFEQTATWLDIVLASDVSYAKAVYCALADLLADCGGAIQVRLLCLEATLDYEFLRLCAARDWKVSARVAEPPASEVVLADGRMALVRTGREGILIHDPRYVRALGTLITRVWRGADRVRDRDGFGDPEQFDLMLRILRRLNTGVKDEVAARELAVSVRTYRRHIAEIMTILSVDSRFQAGVRAAELGLLAPGPHPAAAGQAAKFESQNRQMVGR